MRHTVILIASSIVLLLTVAILGSYVYSLNGDSLDLSSTDMRVVITGSMDGEPRTEYDISTIPLGSMVFVQKVPTGGGSYEFYNDLRVGDILTFHYRNPITGEDMVVTHRITDISDSNGDIIYTVKGDVIADDPTNSSEQVIYASSGDIIGKVVGVSPIFGSIMLFLSSAEGKAILLGCFASILFLIWFGPMISRHVIQKKTRKELD